MCRVQLNSIDRDLSVLIGYDFAILKFIIRLYGQSQRMI